MDKLSEYRRIVKEVLSRHAEQSPSLGDITTAPVFDDEHGNYMVVDMGWDRTGRVHSVVLHLHLRNGKVWIEADGTERGVAEDLMEAGIPKEDIVLAFYRPERRRLTDFAVA